MGASKCNDDGSDEELQRALSESAELHQAIDNERHEARRRLLQTADLYHASIYPVEGDGNCQFRALSVALYGDQESHSALRAKIVHQIRLAESEYAQFVHEPFAEYL